MTSYLTRLLTAGAIGAMVMTQPLLAQGTDSKKFFEELSTRGVKTESLDADKFFAELAARGVSSSNRMDADKFFEELAARGVSTPRLRQEEILRRTGGAGREGTRRHQRQVVSGPPTAPAIKALSAPHQCEFIDTVG